MISVVLLPTFNYGRDILGRTAARDKAMEDIQEILSQKRI